MTCLPEITGTGGTAVQEAAGALGGEVSNPQRPCVQYPLGPASWGMQCLLQSIGPDCVLFR